DRIFKPMCSRTRSPKKLKKNALCNPDTLFNASKTTLIFIPPGRRSYFKEHQEFVDDADFALDIPTYGPTTVEMVNVTKDNFDKDDLVKFQELLLDAEKPLYEGRPDFTKLSVIVKLLNLKGKYGASDMFFTKLLGLIKKMLPTGNEIGEKLIKLKKL
nr:hypothetical protein [Tanacetum cinerariifolium]